MVVTLAHSCLARKTLMPGSQTELMDYMSFHSASTVRTLHSTNFSRITLFQLCGRLHLPTVSFVRTAVLNKQHLCSSCYVWKNVFAAVLLEIKTNTWKDLGWSSQPEQTLFFCTLFCISNPRKGIGSTWDNQDSDRTVGIWSWPLRGELEQDLNHKVKLWDQGYWLRPALMEQGQKKSWWSAEVPFLSVLNQGHTWPRLLKGQAKWKMCWLFMQGEEVIPGQVLPSTPKWIAIPRELPALLPSTHLPPCLLPTAASIPTWALWKGLEPPDQHFCSLVCDNKPKKCCARVLTR